MAGPRLVVVRGLSEGLKFSLPSRFSGVSHRVEDWLLPTDATEASEVCLSKKPGVLTEGS